ncbi:Protein PLANT CADMIUM RESISTANCE 8 [Rhynchospora pubera]|uniref:Protein PLANT CADMIUM RESISTANCE 8 n=1 Tax=Rhynchospora pubera TaxID=906938 RepID=A0AAV8GN90_9POAL|nr:Protein PLANT CADMIUM RESISTANCE 8 [Rhynchospora pubera]
MFSKDGAKVSSEIQEIEQSTSPSNYNSDDHIALYMNTSQRGLLQETNHNKSKFKLGRPTVHPDTESSPSNVQIPSRPLRIPFVKKIDWNSLWKKAKVWIKEPLNMVLFLWIVCVGISGAILFMVMTGMLNSALPKKSERDTWFEVNNQIINALFTLMCLYQHPKRFHHLAMLVRWRADDILKLRDLYCKNGTCKPNERRHMAVVIALLHVNCFAQYALCGLNLGYPRSKRPAIGVGLCLAFSIGAPAFASLYGILSPLGKEYETDVEAQGPGSGSDPTHLQPKSFEKRYSFMSRESTRVQEPNPEWVGGLFDLWDDISLAYLSIFCTCCVFGWNMDRLGFGNMYVHIFTFLLFCLAPFFIFNLAAVNIDAESVRTALGLTGVVLCIFGLLYGGFWRIQMRKRFNLPSSKFCFGKEDLTDCFQWLCCCYCSLAQEVRTGDFYDVVEDKFYYKEMDNVTGGGPSSNQAGVIEENSTRPLRTSGVYAPGWHQSEEEGSQRGTISATEPPFVAVIQK